MKKLLCVLMCCIFAGSLLGCSGEPVEQAGSAVSESSEISSSSSVDADSSAAEASSDASSGSEEASGDVSAASSESVSTSSAVSTLDIEKAEKLLANMRLQEDKVRRFRFYYPIALDGNDQGQWYADVRCFVLPYIGRDANDNVWLQLICNYTEEDWVSFKEVIFAVDDARYTKSFRYFDVVRQIAGGGTVFEYIDFQATSSDIEMLWAIADSTETIVRFQGDDYYYDFTMTAGDKEAIREVLTAYDALT